MTLALKPTNTKACQLKVNGPGMKVYVDKGTVGSKSYMVTILHML